ncbi:hypothetical protein LLG90_24685, partial [Aromatoleum toluclasticum]|uniref:hypothetical protein n=1 Tax=Aromatoleum toluclasticum TaxID=92003 RepID=UPI001D17E7B1
LTACSLNSAVYSCFGMRFTSFFLSLRRSYDDYVGRRNSWGSSHRGSAIYALLRQADVGSLLCLRPTAHFTQALQQRSNLAICSNETDIHGLSIRDSEYFKLIPNLKYQRIISHFEMRPPGTTGIQRPLAAQDERKRQLSRVLAYA